MRADIFDRNFSVGNYKTSTKPKNTMNKTLLEKLLDLVVSSATTSQLVLAEIKTAAQEVENAVNTPGSLWTDAHEAILTAATPPSPAPATQPVNETTTPAPTGGLAAIVCVFLLLFGIGASAQQTSLDAAIAAVGGAPTNYAAELYGTYAPSAPTKYGAGILGIYNVNQNVGLGLGLDWLGGFSMVSGNLQLSAPFHPAPVQFPNFLATPFVLGGVGTPYSGGGKFNGTAAVISDIGFAVEIGHAFGGRFNAGIAWGTWSGIGAYDVKRYHLILGWQHGF